MRHPHTLHVLLALILSGCLAPVPDPVTPTPKPDPVVMTPAAAAEQFAASYSAALATTCQELAQRAAAGEFEYLVDLNDEWVNRSKADRLTAQQSLIAAMNNTLTDETGEKPGVAAAALFEQLAEGFRKGARN